LDRIGPNGVHATVVAPELTSVEMARIEQTYQLLIAHHQLGKSSGAQKPPVESRVLFRGIDGHLPEELLKQGLAPEFFTRSGEVRPVPDKFSDAVKLVTASVACVNCHHCHGLIEKPFVSLHP
jgi:hypothetical protein